MDCSLPGPSVHGIFQARVLECGAIAFSIHEGRYVLFIAEGAEQMLFKFTDEEI